MSFLGEEHATFFRHLINGVDSAISREKHILLTGNHDTGKKQWAE